MASIAAGRELSSTAGTVGTAAAIAAEVWGSSLEIARASLSVPTVASWPVDSTGWGTRGGSMPLEKREGGGGPAAAGAKCAAAATSAAGGCMIERYSFRVEVQN
jgi:hypothetical protein